MLNNCYKLLHKLYKFVINWRSLCVTGQQTHSTKVTAIAAELQTHTAAATATSVAATAAGGGPKKAHICTYIFFPLMVDHSLLRTLPAKPHSARTVM